VRCSCLEDPRVLVLISIAVIYLDRSGADLKPDPLHPPNIRFEARSATELQCRYILFIVSLGTNLV